MFYHRLPTNVLVNFGGNGGSYPLGNATHYTADADAPNCMTQVSHSRLLFGVNTFSASVIYWLPNGRIRIVGIDNGTGVQYVSGEILKWLKMSEPAGPLEIDWLQTHGHADHFAYGIQQNLLLFQNKHPLLMKFWSPNLIPFSREKANGKSLVQRLFEESFSPTRYPVTLEQLDVISTTKRVYQEFTVGETLSLGDDIFVDTHLLNHPDGCCGYRIRIPDRKPIVIATDNDIGWPASLGYIDFIREAGLVYFDAQYTDAEYLGDAQTPNGMRMPRGQTATSPGWGHSCPSHIIKALDRCQDIQGLIVFGHHEPSRMDVGLELFRREIWKRGREAGVKTRNNWYFGKDGATFFWI